MPKLEKFLTALKCILLTYNRNTGEELKNLSCTNNETAFDKVVSRVHFIIGFARLKELCFKTG